jgi:hypothetical protein
MMEKTASTTSPVTKRTGELGAFRHHGARQRLAYKIRRRATRGKNICNGCGRLAAQTKIKTAV